MADVNATEHLNELQDLPPIDSFLPTGLGQELIRQIDESLAEINAIRDESGGLSPDMVRRIEDSFVADRVRHSATIEGSTLDRRETLHVLTTGQIIEGKRRPSEEVRNLGEALRYAGTLLRMEAIREIDIRDIHALLLKELDPHAGRYRPHDVRITNAAYRPPEHLDVPRLMHQLLDLLSNAEHTRSSHGFLIGAYCHWGVARIHPFVDGNGRIARVMQDLYFLRHRLVPAPIPFQQVDEYYETLQQADAGNPTPFVEFVASAELNSLHKYKVAIEESKQTDDWLETLVATANASVLTTEQALYTRYIGRIAELRETFRKLCETLSDRIPEIDVRFRQYSGIDVSQFRQLKTIGRAARTWDFGLEFKYNDHSVRFVFWHGRYTPTGGTLRRQFPQPPLLLVSIEDGDTYRTLHETDEQGISLRAIAVDGGAFHRVRHDPVRDTTELDFGLSSSVICRDFVQEVLRSKLGIG